jgi:hypothetical protein
VVNTKLGSRANVLGLFVILKIFSGINNRQGVIH